MKRVAILAMMAIAITAVCGAPTNGAYPLLVWNATASAPPGFYRIQPPLPLRLGDLVLLKPDPADAALYAERGYLPRGVPLLKPVAAVGGMHVCEQDAHVAIDDRFAAIALPADGMRRPMTHWTGCRTLTADEIFVLNPVVRTSLDGRYFGPSPIAAVLGRAVPLWTWRAQ